MVTLCQGNNRQTFLITKAGKPVAVLSKPPGEQLSIVVDGKGKVHYER